MHFILNFWRRMMRSELYNILRKKIKNYNYLIKQYF